MLNQFLSILKAERTKNFVNNKDSKKNNRSDIFKKKQGFIIFVNDELPEKEYSINYVNEFVHINLIDKVKFLFEANNYEL